MGVYQRTAPTPTPTRVEGDIGQLRSPLCGVREPPAACADDTFQ